MKFQLNKKQILIAMAISVVAFSVGRFSSPKKVELKEVEQVVYRNKEVKDRNQNVIEIEKETRLPDGTVIKERTKKKDTDTRIQRETEKQSKKIVEKSIENRPDWRLIAVYEPSVASFQMVHYQGIVERRILGELYLGISIRSDKAIGLVLSLGF